MRNPFFASLFTGLLLAWACSSSASTYSIAYAPNSPIKNVPLKNAELKIEVYASDIPRGFMKVKTNGNQSLQLKNQFDFEVVAITGEEKYNARCSGAGVPANKTIMITCNPR